MAGFGQAFATSVWGRSYIASRYIDAHVHIWGQPNARFPYDPNYDGPDPDPITFTPDRLLSITQAVGVGRIVLVQMSFYGTDNSYMLNSMRSHPKVFSGIAIVDHNSLAVKSELARLSSLGIRGLRIQQGHLGDDWLYSSAMRSLWALAEETKLAVCCLINPKDISGINMMCEEFPEATVVIDHMARIGMDGPVLKQDVQALCRLAKRPGVNVKLSAFYALGKKKAPYSDLVPLVEALYNAYGAQRLMWGSDSPFQVQPPYSYRSSLDFVLHRLSFLNSGDRESIVRKTAERLFF